MLKGVSSCEWEYFKELISFQPDYMNGYNTPSDFTAQKMQTERWTCAKAANNNKMYLL